MNVSNKHERFLKFNQKEEWQYPTSKLDSTQRSMQLNRIIAKYNMDVLTYLFMFLEAFAEVKTSNHHGIHYSKFIVYLQNNVIK